MKCVVTEVSTFFFIITVSGGFTKKNHILIISKCKYLNVVWPLSSKSHFLSANVWPCIISMEYMQALIFLPKTTTMITISSCCVKVLLIIGKKG